MSGCPRLMRFYERTRPWRSGTWRFGLVTISILVYWNKRNLLPECHSVRTHLLGKSYAELYDVRANLLETYLGFAIPLVGKYLRFTIPPVGKYSEAHPLALKFRTMRHMTWLKNRSHLDKIYSGFTHQDCFVMCHVDWDYPLCFRLFLLIFVGFCLEAQKQHFTSKPRRVRDNIKGVQAQLRH